MEYETVAGEGLHLFRSQERGQIGRGDRGRHAAACELFEKHFGKREPHARQR
jgi:hypothetical protein